MILNFRQLEVFRSIMIAKTLSGAAELLHVSQPGISRLLKHMEYKLGVDLFERSKGKLIPTPEALELYDELEPHYKGLESLDIAIARITRNDDMLFRVACAPSLTNYIAPSLFARIRQKMQGLRIELESMANEEIAEQILQKRIDFAISVYPPDHPLLKSEPSIELGLECIVPKAHPLARRKSVAFHDIVKYEIVGYYAETLLGSKLGKLSADVGHDLDISVKVRYADEACVMVEQGFGLTIAFSFTALPGRYPSLVAVPIKVPPQRIHFVRHGSLPLTRNVRKFYDLAKKEIVSVL